MGDADVDLVELVDTVTREVGPARTLALFIELLRNIRRDASFISGFHLTATVAHGPTGEAELAFLEQAAAYVTSRPEASGDGADPPVDVVVAVISAALHSGTGGEDRDFGRYMGRLLIDKLGVGEPKTQQTVGAFLIVVQHLLEELAQVTDEPRDELWKRIALNLANPYGPPD